MILSICCGAGLFDRAFKDAGHTILAGCEIDPDQRRLYAAFVGGPILCHDLADLPQAVAGQHFTGIIGGPPCQSHTRLKGIRRPKFPDLTPLVADLLAAVSFDWFVFENVCPVALPGASSVKLDAMHFAGPPHQSRPRWFTHSPNITPPSPIYAGSVDDLFAYPGVYGRLYGPKRGAVLQGYPEFAALPFACPILQKGLANGVPRGLGEAWAQEIAARTLN